MLNGCKEAGSRLRRGGRFTENQPTGHRSEVQSHFRNQQQKRTCSSADECPLSKARRTWRGLVSMSANDPKQTFSTLWTRSSSETVADLTSPATPLRRSRASPVFLVVVQCALGGDRPHGRWGPLQNPLEYHAYQCSYHRSNNIDPGRGEITTQQIRS